MTRTWRVTFRHRTVPDLEVEVEVHGLSATMDEEAVLASGVEALEKDARDPQNYVMIRTCRLLRV